jgi:hypothetical protein
LSLRREIYDTLNNLDDDNFAKITAKSIETSGLIVGDNIQMGPNAILSWEQVDGRPNTTYIGPDGIYTGSITAEQIDVGTLTGFTIQTAALGARLILNANGIRSYLTGTTLHGLYFDPASAYAQFRLYHEGVNYFEIERLSGGLYLSAFGNNMLGFNDSTDITMPFGEWDFSSATGIYGINWGDIETNPFGSSTPSSFASASHGHGNNYIKNYATSDNISISATPYGIIVRDGSTTLGQIDYTVIGG